MTAAHQVIQNSLANLRPLLLDEIVNGTYCLEAKQKIGDIWTYGLVFSCTGPLVFGSLVNVIGSAWTRVIAGGSTTVGLILMSFYKSFPSLLLPGVILGTKFICSKFSSLISVAFPSIAWIMLNTFIAPIYKKITVILIVVIPGLINSSATSMLIAKKLYESSEGQSKSFRLTKSLFSSSRTR